MRGHAVTPADRSSAREVAMRGRGGSRRLAPAAALALLPLLACCISLAADPPERLLTLSPNLTAPAGAGGTGAAAAALAVMVPAASQRLAVNRVPVQVTGSSLAYLEDAVWVEQPAQLFRNLLAETIRARGNRMVVDGGELEYAATTQLSGQLVEMGYDVASSSVTVRYDALLALPGGDIRTRRFESTVEGVEPEAEEVGPALNQAANAVAIEVADWVG